MRPDCTHCGSRMAYEDETTRVREFACATCHHRTIREKA